MTNESLNNLESLLVIYFPDFKNEISSLLTGSENFREVAEDYIFCKYEIKMLETSNKETLITQYKETLVELEEELLFHLKVQNENN